VEGSPSPALRGITPKRGFKQGAGALRRKERIMKVRLKTDGAYGRDELVGKEFEEDYIMRAPETNIHILGRDLNKHITSGDKFADGFMFAFTEDEYEVISE
jgi:hypothetical protein